MQREGQRNTKYIWLEPKYFHFVCHTLFFNDSETDILNSPLARWPHPILQYENYSYLFITVSVCLKSSETAKDWLKESSKNDLWSTCVAHLCNIKILRVCLLASQPHRDEDDDGSVVRQGGGRCWLVVLWGRGGLPWSWCPVAVDDISTVHYGGSITKRSDEGL